jgi:hypothetical protein
MAQGGWMVGAKKTAYNRSVYAAPAVAGLVFRSLGHSATLHSHAHSRHILPALVFATQSPYSGWQNVVNSRNVIRHFFSPAFIVAPRRPWRGKFIVFNYRIKESWRRKLFLLEHPLDEALFNKV